MSIGVRKERLKSEYLPFALSKLPISLQLTIDFETFKYFPVYPG